MEEMQITDDQNILGTGSVQQFSTFGLHQVHIMYFCTPGIFPPINLGLLTLLCEIAQSPTIICAIIAQGQISSREISAARV